MLDKMTEPMTIQDIAKLPEPFRGEHKIPLQFTGKWSVDHEEVYEADRITFTYRTPFGITTHKGVVSFDEFMFVVEEYNKEGEVETVFSLNRIQGVRVVGNVYENQ